MQEEVVLVDENDRVTGYMEKMEAHRKGILHRAFSVFIFNSKNELLLQQRALDKYHSAGLWTNTCCSHPRRDETVEDAATRRLQEEMGFSCPLQNRFSFIYRTGLENGLTEHELDHVLTGQWDGTPLPATAEVAAWQWADPQQLLKDIQERPETYTFWFRELLPMLHERGLLK